MMKSNAETEFEPSASLAQSLLLSKRLGEIRTDPFCFFQVDDYLPADLYRALRETFPDEQCDDVDGSGKIEFRSSIDSRGFERFCEEHPAWRFTVDFFRSDEFLRDASRALAPALIQARGWPARRPWLNCSNRTRTTNALEHLIFEPVRTTYQISLLPRDAVVVPHADAPRKLVSLILYFRDEDWEDAYGGSTEFLVPNDPERARTWAPTDRIPFEEFKTIGATPFAPNRLAGFVRSDASFHGVAPITCPPGMARRALLINIKRLKWSKRDQL